jgi:DNA-binding NarL/FixJ family response regulator
MLVDDHKLVRQALCALLKNEEDIELIGEANDGREAVRMDMTLQADVIIMDIAMPELNGMEAMRQILINNPSTKVLILSTYSDDEYVHQFIRAGASGYINKQDDVANLIRAVRVLHHGNICFSRSISRRLIDEERKRFLAGGSGKKKHERKQLTSRELEVIQLIAEGYANKTMAAHLGVSIKTIEKHRQSIMNKLNIHHVAGLTRYAIAHSICEAPLTLR